MDTERSRRYLIALMILTLIGAILRFRELDAQSLWMDELAALHAGRLDTWEESMGTGRSGLGFPGFVSHLYIQLFGDSDFAIRSLSALSGIVLIPIVAEFARRLRDEKAAIVTAALITTSFFAIRYSQEFRPYMFPTMVLWACLLYLADATVINTRKTIWVILGLAFVFVTHTVASVTISIALFTMATCKFIDSYNQMEDSRPLKEKISTFWLGRGSVVTLASICILTLGLITLPAVLEDSGDGSHSDWIPATPESAHLVLLEEFLGYESEGSVNEGFAGIAWVMILSSPLLALIHNRTRENRQSIWKEPEWMLLTISLGTFFFITTYSEQIRPLFVIRYFAFSMPAWIIILGIWISRALDLSMEGFDEEGDGRAVVAVIFSALILSSGITWLTQDYDYYGREQKTDFRGMAEWLDTNVDNNSHLILVQPTQYYWEEYLERMDSELIIDYNSWGYLQPYHKMRIDNYNHSVVIVASMGQYPDILAGELDNTHIMAEEVTFYDGHIVVYTHPGVDWR